MIALEYSGMWIGEKEGTIGGEPTSVLGSPYGKISRTARIPSRRLKRDVTKRY